MANKAKKDHAILHLLIGIGIMIGFRFLPVSLPHVTPTGMEILGIFIGTLYLWTTSDPIPSSIISIFMVGISSYSNMNEVLTSTFGNPILVQVFFMLTVINCLIENNLTEYCGRFFLTRKICLGRPWLLVFVICMGCMLMAAFMGGFTPVFLFWPIIYKIYEIVGLKKEDKFSTILLILVIISSLLGFPIPPFMGNGLALISNYATVTTNMNNPVMINSAGYMATGLIHGTVCIIAIVLFCKFVLKPDISKFKELKLEDLNSNALPPLNFKQKFVAIAFVCFVATLLVPSIIPNSVIGKLIKSNTYGIALFVVFVLCSVRVQGQPIMNFSKTIQKMNWASFFLIASAILLGNALTAKNTGVSLFLNELLLPIFAKIPAESFALIVMLLTVGLTNVCNSFVIGILLQPVIATFCFASGVSSAPIVAMMIIFVLSSAAITPAASPFAAIMFGNGEWIKAKDAYKYGFMFVIIETIVVCLISLPIAQLLIG